MTKELIVALEIARSDLADTLSGLVKGLPGVKVLAGPILSVDKGAVAAKLAPDVIVIDDNPQPGDLLRRLRLVREGFPQAALFVVSANRDPQHIIDAMKAGVAEYLVEPVDRQTLINAVEDVRAKLGNGGRLSHGKIFSFISAKGGVGATVLAVNTATALSLDKNRSVALIDMSFQAGDTSVLLDIVPHTTILDICQNILRLDVAFMRGVVIPHKTGINFLAAPRELEDCDEIHASHVASVLDLAVKLYDNIVIDCSSMHINDCSIEAFHRSEKLFVVTDMSVPSIRNTARLYKLIRKFGIPDEKIEIVINRFIKESVLPLSEIEKSFEKPVYWLVPNDFADIVSSINRGIPLITMTPGAPFSKNLLEFTKKILQQHAEPAYRGVRNLFGKSL